MECVETHAYHTYDDFLKNFGEKLKTKPAPAVAVKYYTEGELYMFGEFNNGLVCSLQWCSLLTSALRLDRNVSRLCKMRAAVRVSSGNVVRSALSLSFYVSLQEMSLGGSGCSSLKVIS
jgi:hypothetical protein